MRAWALLLALAAAIIAATGLPLRVRLDRPRLGTPLVQEPGTKLEVYLRTSLPWAAPAAQLSLEDDAGAEFPLAAPTRWWRGNILCLTTRIPDLGDGRYALRVRTPGQDLRQPGAVFVRRTWPASFFIVQAADFPPPGKGGLLPQFIEEMNLLQPAAVLGTGDISYDVRAEWYAFLLENLGRLEMPFLAAPGNHERKGWAAYLRAFGPGPQRADLGPLRVLSLDSAHGRDQFTPSEFHWIKNELENLDGRTPIIQVHHPVMPAGPAIHGEAGGSGGFLNGYRRPFMELCRIHHVPLVLSGHWHSDAIFDEKGALRDDRADFPGTHYAVVTALGNELRQVTRWPHQYHGYRIIRFTEGRLVSETYDLAGAGRPNPVASVPLGRLHVRALPGGAVEARNDLNESFESVQVTIEGATPGLRPDQGVLVDVLPAGNAFTYRVRLPLPAHSVRIVRLERP
ncbi:MAG: hypothetical protein HGA66_03110 [Holophaga sp.]|nr:hypothetical protein [Holophaga sp.]